MKIYKVELDLTLVLPRLKSFKLKEFNHKRPIIFVEANDPDEACFLATFRLASIILKQDSSSETAELVVDILKDVSVKKAIVPK
tara:strand:- start:605 stop:856 length:252 start_codon:yes stop_codon:yes gene_type:complete